jgi:enoyl-CoA hydratase
VIRREQEDSVFVLRMEHGKANALDVEFSGALASTLAELDRDEECAAAVLTGSGTIFSAGVDLFRVLDGGSSYLDVFLPALTQLMERLRGFSKPLVAAVNGHAIAGGGVMALATDYRLMSDGEGRIGVPELRVGVPFPGAALEIVQAAVPAAHLGDVVLRGGLFTAREARARGLVHEIVESEALRDRAIEIGHEMTQVPRETYAITKRRLRAVATAPVDLAYEAEVEELWKAPEMHAAIRAYLERTIGKSSRDKAN